MAISSHIFDYLICPLSGEILYHDKKRRELIAKKSGLAYPIRDNIPILVVAEARILKEEDQ